VNKKDLENVIDIADVLSNILILTMILIQQVSNRSREEVLASIAIESLRTEELLEKLK
jgi:hypothetical protein